MYVSMSVCAGVCAGVRATWRMAPLIGLFIPGTCAHYNLILETQVQIRFISIKIFRSPIQTTQYKKREFIDLQNQNVQSYSKIQGLKSVFL